MTVPYDIICEDINTISHDEWLNLRKQGIGSSDAAAALNVSPWQSQYGLYCDKLGLLPPLEDNDVVIGEDPVRTELIVNQVANLVKDVVGGGKGKGRFL